MGYVISMGIAADPSGWDDPVFNVVRKLPLTPYSWAAILFISVSVYLFGESSNLRKRGVIIIVGATMCSMWFNALSLMMARMVYELPNRITVLWPFITFFVAALYATPIVVYSGIFTGERWRTNPYQLWGTCFVIVVSLSQIVIGVAPGTIFTEVEHPIMLQLALTNFLGGTVVLFGLHLKNKENALNLELAGSFSLVATLAWYCASVTTKQTLATTTLGFGLAEAYTLATLHRATQILTLKWARWKGKLDQEESLTAALHNELSPDRR